MSRYTLGIDTSNYATSLAVFDTAGEVVCAKKRFLPVKAANPLGLTCAVYGIYLYNLYMEEGFGSLCNFNLVTYIFTFSFSNFSRKAT